MKLQEVLDAYRCCAESDLSPADQEVLALELDRLRRADWLSKALRTGDIAPDFVLPDAPGAGPRLTDLLHEGPVILKFYRGRWCAFCTLELRAYQRLLPEFRALGAELIALSPQNDEQMALNRERDHLRFPMITDADNAVARQFGITYEIGPEMRERYVAAGMDLSQMNASSTWSIPLPAVYLIAPDRRIAWSYVDPNYLQRAEPAALLEALRRLQLGASPLASPGAALR